jgi:hypothetical protein
VQAASVSIGTTAGATNSNAAIRRVVLIDTSSAMGVAGGGVSGIEYS